MRTVVGVLRGGPSSEYEVSLKTGASVLAELDRERYEPRDLFVDRAGAWHVHGRAVAPEKALLGVDVVFNAMHGHFGEDGQAQRLLDLYGVPYTGSDALASAVAFNKAHTRDAVRKLGIKVAHGAVYNTPASVHDLAQHIFRTMPHPAIVKPVVGGSSVGTTVAESYHGLERALEIAFAHAEQVLVEEFIKGRDASVGVIDHFRGEETYATLPMPLDLSRDQKDWLVNHAKAAHRALGLHGYSQADFVVSRRGIYLLEVNNLPKLHEGSKFFEGLRSVGAKTSDFLHHALTLARGRKKA